MAYECFYEFRRAGKAVIDGHGGPHWSLEDARKYAERYLRTSPCLEAVHIRASSTAEDDIEVWTLKAIKRRGS